MDILTTSTFIAAITVASPTTIRMAAKDAEILQQPVAVVPFEGGILCSVVIENILPLL